MKKKKIVVGGDVHPFLQIEAEVGETKETRWRQVCFSVIPLSFKPFWQIIWVSVGERTQNFAFNSPRLSHDLIILVFACRTRRLSSWCPCLPRNINGFKLLKSNL